MSGLEFLALVVAAFACSLAGAVIACLRDVEELPEGGGFWIIILILLLKVATWWPFLLAKVSAAIVCVYFFRHSQHPLLYSCLAGATSGFVLMRVFPAVMRFINSRRK